MSVQPGDILRDTEPTPVDGVAGRFSAVIPEAWRIFYAFGGATMATALRVAEAALEREDLHLVSSEAMFCQAIPVGPVAASAEIVRRGRSAAQVLVRLWALDPESPDPSGPERSDLMVMCVFGLSEKSPFEFVGAIAPEVPDPQDCPQPAPRPADSPFNNIPYHEQTEFRFSNSTIKWNEEFPSAEPESASWFRFKVPPLRSDGSWHPAPLALPGDILGPAVHAGAGGSVPPFLVIILQLGLQIVAEVRGEWLLQHTRSQVAGSGYASGTAEIYDQERRLVAVATQCAKIQPIKLG
ncbi:MAG: thioesterase family protein [Actinobacteria bacterium]|nr:thioesterase family protein [Actinomycetota bacterium]